MFTAPVQDEIMALAMENGLSPAALLAIVEVESGGRVFAHIHGRKEPLIRFEGHYFYRLLPQAKRNRAVVSGLANPRWGKVKNPLRQINRWRMLERARKIDNEAALSSCSWGVGQVMGSHWRWLGFADIAALVTQARSGADGQVDLMLRFIKKAGLENALREKDWRGFARGYNGPAYARHGYHTRMARAYARHAVETGEPILAPMRNAAALLRFGSRGEPVRNAQELLVHAGFSLKRDGDFGPATRRAVLAFQSQHSLTLDGVIGPNTYAKLMRYQPALA